MSTEPISSKNNIDLFSLGTELVEQNELEQINPPFPIYRLFMKGTLKSLISMEFFLFFLRKISQLHALLEPPRLFIFGEKSHLHDY